MDEIQDDLVDVRHVFMEITSRCNMNCKFCPYDVMTRPKQDMPHEYALKILRELAGKNKTITFHVMGEPLLNPHFFEYARFCDEHGIKYWLVTNGLMLTESVCDKLFSLKNLQNVEISFHTFAEGYHLRSCGMPYAKYLERVKNAVFSRKRYEAGIQINIDVMYDLNLLEGKVWNNFTLERWHAFAQIIQQWAVELNEKFPDAKERYSKYYSSRKKIFHKDNYYSYRQYEDIPTNLFLEQPLEITWLGWEFFPKTYVSVKKFFFFTKKRAYLENTFPAIDQYEIVEPKKFPCQCSRDLTVMSDGRISVCCLDYEGDLALGNIADMSLAQAASNHRRQKFAASPDQFKFCRQCMGWLQKKQS